MLILVSTPIGNLDDLSFRAVQTLKNADLILCEDTRRTKILLQHIEAPHVPCKSYHTWNEKKEIENVIALLQTGKTIALVTDAGTPLISDPGFELVREVVQQKLPIDAIPGPCAPIAALLLSGLPCSRFQFIGFLPKAAGERQKALSDCLHYPGTSILFESPHRIHDTLEELNTLAPNHEIAIARELTKLHQEVLRGTVSELLGKEVRGEVVLMIGPGSAPKITLDEATTQVLALYRNGTSLSDASHQIAQNSGYRKKELYSEALKLL